MEKDLSKKIKIPNAKEKEELPKAEEVEEKEEIIKEELKIDDKQECPKVTEDLPYGVAQEFIKQKQDFLDMQMTNVKIFQELQLSNIELVRITKSIKEHQGLFVFIVMAIVAFTFLIIGMNSEKWLPYISDAYEAFKTAKSATPIGKIGGD